jgi:phage baseplate assembly protein W
MGSATYPLIQPATNPSLFMATLLTPGVAAPSAAFLGYGILSPLQRDQKQDFANAGGLPLIQSCIAQILGTQCSADGAGVEQQGELRWRPGFGSLLYRLKFLSEGSVLNDLARVYIVDALKRWEPRVAVSSAVTTFDRVRRALLIDLVYDVISSNVPGNAVVLPDVEQQVNVSLGGG